MFKLTAKKRDRRENEDERGDGQAVESKAPRLIRLAGWHSVVLVIAIRPSRRNQPVDDPVDGAPSKYRYGPTLAIGQAGQLGYVTGWQANRIQRVETEQTICSYSYVSIPPEFHGQIYWAAETALLLVLEVISILLRTSTPHVSHMHQAQIHG
jgi:hypothetical protein